MRKTVLILMAISTLANAEFSRSGNSVTDTVTGLQWQDNNDTSSIEKNWYEAIEYCESLVLDGYSDWRLPNINELASIIDYTKRDPAIINGFTYVRSRIIYILTRVYIRTRIYWSSTTRIYGSHYAWVVDFDDGDVDYSTKDTSHYVRCVRAGE